MASNYRLIDENGDVRGAKEHDGFLLETGKGSLSMQASFHHDELQRDETEDGGTNDDSKKLIQREESFVQHFVSSDGPPQIFVICLLLALALGCTVGVVPAVMTDRYARLNHGFDSSMDCSLYEKNEKPAACIDGSDDAQNAAAISSLISNLLTFTTSSLMGSISDQRGRKGILLLGIFLSLLSPLCLVLLQIFDTMNPAWYYATGCLTGLVNWIAVALSALSDVMPQKWRAPTFGLLLAGFSLGFALSPVLALGFSHFGVSVLSLSLLLGMFVFAALFLPETLPREVVEEAARVRADEETEEMSARRVIDIILRPLRELSILNRNRLFRLLSTLAFFSGVVSSGDQTVLLYYVEGRFDFDDHDIAIMFGIIGIMGIIIQGVLLKPLNDCIGERLVVFVSFVFGIVSNMLYGLATSKTTIYLAIIVATFQGMSFPTISAIKSNNVDEREQGRIQGALYSLSSLASALGPVTLRYVYHETKDSPYPGPGTMFIFAAALYVIAAICACALPEDQANSRRKQSERRLSDDSDHSNDASRTELL